MDKTKLERLITENMKSVFGFALTRLANVQMAEELASDILYELLRSAHTLRDEERFYGFMWKIAENTYAAYLRRKSRHSGKTEELSDAIEDGSEPIADTLIRKEEINVLRRELSLLSRQYRETAVLYYIEDLSCSETAERLNISTEMVKYYLFRARKIIREGMNMERLFGEKSYRPDVLEIDFWGTKAGEDREYTEFRQRKIKGNILLSAYYTPVTAQEISVELGVSLPYLEDEIALLLKRQYLLEKNGKYLTNIPIFTAECTKSIEDKLRAVTKAAAEKFAAVQDGFAEKYGGRFANENLIRWQRLLLCMHFSLCVTDNLIAEKYGELPKDGPYSLVNGGGGRGVVWGRSRGLNGEGEENAVMGIYDSASPDGRGHVIAINFRQTLNGQRFMSGMTAPIVAAAAGSFAYLPEQWQKELEEEGWTQNGIPQYPVYTAAEFEELRKLLSEGTEILTALHRQTAATAAEVTADLAPSHIRGTAEYVGALVYRFRSVANIASVLFESGYLQSVTDVEKPAMCVILR